MQHPYPTSEQAQRIGLTLDAYNQPIEAPVPLYGQRLDLPQPHKS